MALAEHLDSHLLRMIPDRVRDQEINLRPRHLFVADFPLGGRVTHEPAASESASGATETTNGYTRRLVALFVFGRLVTPPCPDAIFSCAFRVGWANPPALFR